MGQKVVNLHFLLVDLSSLGGPVFGRSCVYGADEGLEERDAQPHLGLLVAESPKAPCSHDADAHACDDGGGGGGGGDGVVGEPPLCFPQ